MLIIYWCVLYTLSVLLEISFTIHLHALWLGLVLGVFVLTPLDLFIHVVFSPPCSPSLLTPTHSRFHPLDRTHEHVQLIFSSHTTLCPYPPQFTLITPSSPSNGKSVDWHPFKGLVVSGSNKTLGPQCWTVSEHCTWDPWVRPYKALCI